MDRSRSWAIECHETWYSGDIVSKVKEYTTVCWSQLAQTCASCPNFIFSDLHKELKISDSVNVFIMEIANTTNQADATPLPHTSLYVNSTWEDKPLDFVTGWKESR
jgi:hypothetical protein